MTKLQLCSCIALALLLSSCLVAAFDCPTLSPTKPSNINNLSPNDITVIMALGDSITAGFGIQGTAGGTNEYRGLSYSIGGNPNATTLSKFLQFYTPSLVGSSLGVHEVEVCIDPVCPDYQYHPALDVFNAAQSGAMTDDLPKHELNYLINQLTINSKVDMQNDWKLLTILIGANDLCGACTLVPSTVPVTFETQLRATLERVRTSIPRTFVNLVMLFNISGVYTVGLQNAHCQTVRKDLPIECDCLFSTNDTFRSTLDELAQNMNSRMSSIAADYQSQNYPGFTVVAQPFGSDTSVVNLGLSFLSTLDCFHPSLLAHEAMATALWNNMLTPAAKKKTVLNPSDVPMCPTAQTRLFTN